MATFELVTNGPRQDAHATMAREVRAGLSRVPRSTPPKYFYDERGCRLFDAICDLPEYYLTRAEASLLAQHARDIVANAGATALVEIGSGMARKTGLLVDALCAHSELPTYVPFDIAPAPIEASAHALRSRHPQLRVRGLVGDFTYHLPSLSSAAPASEGPRLFALLGSTIGNLEARDAATLVQSIARQSTEADRFLLGVDIVKDPHLLHAAYNDSQGVTAAFNKNILRVLSRELDGDFEETAFDHLAFYDGERQRIEMHLVSASRQTVNLRKIGLRMDLAAGERIMTEISRKFTRAAVERTLADGGMRMTDWLCPEGALFALCVARKV